MADAAPNPVAGEIQSMIDNHDVVLFMKGTPQFPQCGFSSVVSQILNYVGAQPFTVNVLERQDMREGVKAFSNWPTIPQLYVKGEFIGGCDIVKEMFEAGELKPYLAEKGVIAAA